MLALPLPKAAFLDYSMGVTRLFCSADVGRRGMVGGWSQPEDSHTWNDGHEAVLSLATKPHAEPCRLVVEGEPYLPMRQPTQNVTLYANGHRAGFWRLSSRDHNHLEAVLEPEWWFLRGSCALMKLAFHLPDSIRPSDAIGAPDERLLGFCFRSFVISGPAGHP
jgi:hypothetical protein